MTGASNDWRAFGQSVGSVPMGVFLRRDENRHVWRACRVCFVVFVVECVQDEGRLGSISPHSVEVHHDNISIEDVGNLM